MRTNLILPDNNIFSEVVKTVPNSKLLGKYYQNLHNIGVTITVWHELLYGIHNMPMGKRREMIENHIRNDVAMLPKYFYTEECAEIHAQIRANCRKKGKTLAFADSQIASIAMANNAVLVTRNVSDFEGVDGLKIENWFE